MPLRTVADQLRSKLRRHSSTFLVPKSSQDDIHQPIPISSHRSSVHHHRNSAIPAAPTPTPPPLPPPPGGGPAASPRTSARKHKTPKKEYPPSPDTLVNGIGDYRFVEQIGHGKFSKVMLAQHYRTGDRVAIKIIDKRAHVYRVMSRLVREVTLMEILDHKNIIHLYETYETADLLYIIMEYVPGVNLDEHLRRSHGSLSEDEARMVFRQLIAAVDYCHRHWVVHRDIKTPNVLLMPNGEIRLADFGLGNRFSPHQRLKTLCGSMLYYSPEIFSGQRYTGPEVDCWCLGVSLFRMTAGFEPFSHARDQEQLKKYVVSGNYPMPEKLSPGLQATIRKCLTVDRRKRMGLRIALKDDPWLNNYGRLPDLFPDEETKSDYLRGGGGSIPAAITSDEPVPVSDRERNRQRYIKDMDEEKRNGHHVKKTILYHPISPSIYFTTRTAQYTPSSKREHIVQSQEMLQKQLIKEVRAELREAQLHPLSASHELQSPIHRLLRKIKGTTANGAEPKRRLKKQTSTLSLTQIYQRVAKDQITYYTLVSRTPIYSLEESLILLVRAAAGILGVTYCQETPVRLVCTMNMQRVTAADRHNGWFYGLTDGPHQNGNKTLSASTPMLSNNQDPTRSGSFATTMDGPSSLLSNASTNNSRWSRALKRLSTPFGQQDETMMMPWSQSFQFQSSMTGTPIRNAAGSHPPVPPPAAVAALMADEEDNSSNSPGKKEQTTVIFTVDAFLSSESREVVGLRFSKTEGSNKVFKYAKGWITGVLAYNEHDPLS
ncbi:kinase-like domain-containing protein [Dichotomocladium elegans]|nr:kinase-like domain-containing protein [Dichotomocladium elegans]